MKTEQILNESPAALIKQIWNNIQNLFTDMQDELYDMRRNPETAELATQILQALEKDDIVTVHKLLQHL